MLGGCGFRNGCVASPLQTMTVFSLCGVVITFSSIKQIPTPEGLRAERVVGADPCVCPEMRFSMHGTRRVTTGGYPYIREINGENGRRGRPLCSHPDRTASALILIVPVSRPRTRSDRRSPDSSLCRYGTSIIFVIGGLRVIYVLPTQNPWCPQSRPTSNY